jgi:hypothetical protein
VIKAKTVFHHAAFGQTASCVEQGVLTVEAAIDVMSRATLAHYPDCINAFGHGSALHGRFAPFSDLDVVAILPSGAFWEKKCVNFEGYLVEFQAFTLDIVDLLIPLALQSGMSVGLGAGAGQTLIDRDGNAEALRGRLAAALEAGPSPASRFVLDGFRNKLTNHIVELRGASEPMEQLACGLAMFEIITRVQMTLDVGWRHSGKWIPRALAAKAPDAFPNLAAAYKQLVDGDREPLLSLASDLLDRIGGPLWSGYSATFPVRPELLPVSALVTAAQQIRG